MNRNRLVFMTGVLAVACIGALASTALMPAFGRSPASQQSLQTLGGPVLTTPSGVSLKLTGYEIVREEDSVFIPRISAELTNGSSQPLYVLGGLAPEQPYLSTEVARAITTCRHHFLWWDWNCFTWCYIPPDENHLTPINCVDPGLRIAAGVTGDSLEHSLAPADVMVAVVASRDVQRIASALDVDTTQILQYTPSLQPGETWPVVLQAPIHLIDTNLILKPITIGVTLADDQGSNDVQVFECGVTGECSSTSTLCVTPPSGMVAWWPLDESSGAVQVKDIAGPNVGSYQGTPAPVSVSGRVDRGLEFTANTISYVRAPRALPQHDYRNVTIDAWIYLYTLPPSQGWGPFVGYGGITGPGIYGLALEGSGEVSFYTQPIPLSHWITTMGANITQGVWHHLAATANSATHELRIYVDGNLRALQSGNYDPTNYYADYGWTIGDVYTPDCIDGVIDEVEIFERALDPHEIMDIVNAGSAGKCKGCAATGDINGDGIILTVADLAYLTAFVNGGGPPPIPLYQGDLNGDGYIDQGDVEILNCYFTYGMSCFPVLPVPTSCNPDTLRGACCDLDTCDIRSQYNCEQRSGTYFGDGTACSPEYCWGQICGAKFNDLNGDGDQDAGEPPVSGVQITFVPAVSGVTNPVLTDAYGLWCFGPMPAGTYQFHETVPANMAQTAPASVFVTADVRPQAAVDLGPVFGNEDTCVSALQHLDTCLAGRKDNFATGDGAELAAPSATLCAFLNSVFPLGPLDDCNPSPLNCSEFDCAVPNRGFGHTFTGCWDSTCTVVHAWLHLVVRSSGVGSANDGLGLYQNGVGVWGVSFTTLDPTWPANVLDTWLYLEQLPASPSYPGITNVLAALQDGDLDVVIQDDTEVDFLELIVSTCCHCVEPPPNMVAWWPLDETAGPTAFDIAGVPNNGTWIDNPTPVQGKVSGALDFHLNFSYDHVTVDDQSEINFGNGDFSIDAWVKIRNQTSIYDIGILDKLVRSGPNYTGYALDAVTYGSAAYLAFSMGDGGSTAGLSSNPVIPYNTWTHVAVTVSRTAGGTLYIDGSPVVSSVPVPLGSVTNALPLLIGATRIVGAIQAPIAIDEVELFNRALNPSEVYSIWKADSLGKCKPCCDCPHQGDINGDGVIDVFDVIAAIDIAFGGAPDPKDPCCPLTRGDVNGDGVTDVFDVIYLIDHSFVGGPGPVDPCP